MKMHIVQMKVVAVLHQKAIHRQQVQNLYVIFQFKNMFSS